MNPASRIYFKDSAYPQGHRIEKFVWSGRLEPGIGIWFDLHLETAPYQEDDNSEDTGEPHWTSKGVWTNYSRCILSSSYWNDHGGILAGTQDHKLDFNSLDTTIFRADILPRPEVFDINDGTAFNIYLLGHDDCADHLISFPHRGQTKHFDISWKGKIALAYSGQHEFNYEFEALIRDVAFDGIHIPDTLSVDHASNLLTQFVTDPHIFELDKNINKFCLNI